VEQLNEQHYDVYLSANGLLFRLNLHVFHESFLAIFVVPLLIRVLNVIIDVVIIDVIIIDFTIIIIIIIIITIIDVITSFNLNVIISLIIIVIIIIIADSNFSVNANVIINANFNVEVIKSPINLFMRLL